MKIYNYHPETGEYVGVEAAVESPLEPGVYLLPASSSLLAPPEAGGNEVAVFADGAWSVLADFRGTSYYTTDGVYHTITQIGEVEPNDALDSAPALTAAQVAAARIAAIDSRLTEIDRLSSRPAREVALALSSGAAVDGYTIDKLAALEAEAVALRAERKTLVGG